MIYRGRCSVYNTSVMCWSESFWLMAYMVFVIVFCLAVFYFFLGFFLRVFLFAFRCGMRAWPIVTWPIRRLFALVCPGKKKSKNEVVVSWDDEDDSF